MQCLCQTPLAIRTLVWATLQIVERRLWPTGRSPIILDPDWLCKYADEDRICTLLPHSFNIAGLDLGHLGMTFLAPCLQKGIAASGTAIATMLSGARKCCVAYSKPQLQTAPAENIQQVSKRVFMWKVAQSRHYQVSSRLQLCNALLQKFRPVSPS